MADTKKKRTAQASRCLPDKANEFCLDKSGKKSGKKSDFWYCTQLGLNSEWARSTRSLTGIRSEVSVFFIKIFYSPLRLRCVYIVMWQLSSEHWTKCRFCRKMHWYTACWWYGRRDGVLLTPTSSDLVIVGTEYWVVTWLTKFYFGKRTRTLKNFISHTDKISLRYHEGGSRRFT